ncbi:hypothetical protein A5695_12975 [Mycobacterium sp. E1747]|nr:hypothetical protein A5695_12975 [Mycobacterium sp. E1747]
MHALQLVGVGALERRLAGEAFVEQAGQRVHVGLRADPAGGEPLGRHVHPRRLGARNAEVDQIREVIGGQQHVLRPDAQVQQPGGVRGIQRPRHLRDDRRGARRFQRPPFAQQVLQTSALDQVHVDEEHLVDRTKVVHRDNVGFLQSRGDPTLALKALLEAGIRGYRGRQ